MSNFQKILFILCIPVLFPAQLLSQNTIKLNAGVLNFEGFCEKTICPNREVQGDWFHVKGDLWSPNKIMGSKPYELSLSKVPRTWNPTPVNPFHQDWNKSRDVGTYWIKIKNFGSSDLHRNMGIQIGGIFTAYKVYWSAVNSGVLTNQLLYDSGWDYEQPLESKGTLLDQFLPLEVHQGATEYLLTIHVANALHSKGGFRRNIQIGPIQNLVTSFMRPQIFFSFYFGAMIIIAFYHILIFLQRNEDLPSLWLAIECLLLSVFLICRHGVFEQIFDEPSNMIISIRTRLEYLINIVAVSAFYGFLVTTFPKAHQKYFEVYIKAISMMALFLVLTPVSFFTRLYLVFFVPFMVISIVGVLVLSILTAKHYPRLKFMLAGITLLGIAGINDGLAGASIIESPKLMIYAQMSFIFLQGAIISQRFAEAYELAKSLTQKLQIEVERQIRDIKSILTAINQGIFTVEGEGLRLGQQRSDFLKELVPENYENLKDYLEDTSELTTDSISQVTETLNSSIGYNEINFVANCHLLPKELNIRLKRKWKHLEVDWTPILNSKDEVEKVLVCLRDVTEINTLKEESRQHQEDIKLLNELLLIPEDQFRNFVNRTRHHLDENELLIGSLLSDQGVDSGEVIRQIFMNIHTIKGTARTLHLKGIAKVSHDAENAYLIDKTTDIHSKVDRLREDLKAVKAVVDHYDRLSREKLGWEIDQDSLKVSRSLIIDALCCLTRFHQDFNNDRNDIIGIDISRTIENLEKQSRCSLKNIIQDLTHGLGSVARDLGKEPPEVNVSGNNVMLTDRGSRLIQSIFTHMLRNSIDHGLENPLHRKKFGKPPKGSVEIIADKKPTHLSIICFDDGRGLHLEKIWKRATEHSVVEGPYPEQAIEVAELIFHPGLTTKDKATEISGRGVGMDAVRSYLRKYGGEIDLEITSTPNHEGYVQFRLIIQMPDDCWWDSGNVVPHVELEKNAAS